MVFIKIVGIYNSANEVFHCVHFECPSQISTDLLEKSQLVIDERKPSSSRNNISPLNSRQDTNEDLREDREMNISSLSINKNLNNNVIEEVSDFEEPSINNLEEGHKVEDQISLNFNGEENLDPILER